MTDEGLRGRLLTGVSEVAPRLADGGNAESLWTLFFAGAIAQELPGEERPVAFRHPLVGSTVEMVWQRDGTWDLHQVRFHADPVEFAEVWIQGRRPVIEVLRDSGRLSAPEDTGLRELPVIARVQPAVGDLMGRVAALQASVVRWRDESPVLVEWFERAVMQGADSGNAMIQAMSTFDRRIFLGLEPEVRGAFRTSVRIRSPQNTVVFGNIHSPRWLLVVQFTGSTPGQVRNVRLMDVLGTATTGTATSRSGLGSVEDGVSEVLGVVEAGLDGKLADLGQRMEPRVREASDRLRVEAGLNREALAAADRAMLQAILGFGLDTWGLTAGIRRGDFGLPGSRVMRPGFGMLIPVEYGPGSGAGTEEWIIWYDTGGNRMSIWFR